MQQTDYLTDQPSEQQNYPPSSNLGSTAVVMQAAAPQTTVVIMGGSCKIGLINLKINKFNYTFLQLLTNYWKPKIQSGIISQSGNWHSVSVSNWICFTANQLLQIAKTYWCAFRIKRRFENTSSRGPRSPTRIWEMALSLTSHLFKLLSTSLGTFQSCRQPLTFKNFYQYLINKCFCLMCSRWLIWMS